MFPPVSALVAMSLVVADRALVMVAALLLLLMMLPVEELLLWKVSAATRMPMSSEGEAIPGDTDVAGEVTVGDSRDAEATPSMREWERCGRREKGVRLDRTEAEWLGFTVASLVDCEGECREGCAGSLWPREMKGIWMEEREEEFW